MLLHVVNNLYYFSRFSLDENVCVLFFVCFVLCFTNSAAVSILVTQPWVYFSPVVILDQRGRVQAQCPSVQLHSAYLALPMPLVHLGI